MVGDFTGFSGFLSGISRNPPGSGLSRGHRDRSRNSRLECEPVGGRVRVLAITFLTEMQLTENLTFI
jgi:hypothetical protein